MLILLDVDGTLCNTFNIDGECYVESLRRCFGFHNISTDPASYIDTTDSGILQELFVSRLNRAPTVIEESRMVDCFHGLLAESFCRNPNQCRAINGGPSFLSQLRSRKIPFAIATGGWKRTAVLKLQSAGYGDLDFPITTADDATCRLDICNLAVNAASKTYRKSLTPIVYVGDGSWDQQAAEKLGYHFVGRSSQMTNFDDPCDFVIPDFADPGLIDRFLELQICE